MAIRHSIAVLALIAAIAGGAHAAEATPRPGPTFVGGKSCEANFVTVERCERVDGQRVCRLVRRFVGYTCVLSQG